MGCKRTASGHCQSVFPTVFFYMSAQDTGTKLMALHPLLVGPAECTTDLTRKSCTNNNYSPVTELQKRWISDFSRPVRNITGTDRYEQSQRTQHNNPLAGVFFAQGLTRDSILAKLKEPLAVICSFGSTVGLILASYSVSVKSFLNRVASMLFGSGKTKIRGLGFVHHQRVKTYATCSIPHVSFRKRLPTGHSWVQENTALIRATPFIRSCHFEI